MNGDRGDDARRAGARGARVSSGVLADRMAATLVHHEPGWRLPRLTALARRFNVSVAEVDVAVGELAARHLLSRLPDGQVYRASPAEYRVPLEGLVGLSSHVDPMGGRLVCKSRHVSRRRPPQDIGRSLRLAPGEPVLAVRCLWTVGGEPGALSASYLPERLGHALPELSMLPFATQPGGDGPLAAGPLGMGPPADGAAARTDAVVTAAAGRPADQQVPQGQGGPAASGPYGTAAGTTGASRARALQIELSPPPPSVARSLRLGAGELVTTVTVSFEDPAAHSPVALTTAMLRPDLFRIVIEASAAQPAEDTDGFATNWTRTVAGWEP
jgi:UTRA domain